MVANTGGSWRNGRVKIAPLYTAALATVAEPYHQMGVARGQDEGGRPSRASPSKSAARLPQLLMGGSSGWRGVPPPPTFDALLFVTTCSRLKSVSSSPLISYR
jgi:hypothetical protein